MSVDQDEDQVKSTQQACLDARIGVYVQLRIPFLSTSKRVRRCKYCRPRIDFANDAGFGHRYGLLFHSFMYRALVFFSDQSKLVHSAYPTVSQDQSSSFEYVLTAFLEGGHCESG